mmetsp:Transcript_27538/g.41670  ORF Transcript_27538/g.41670 Transcript_27538/m.41670 type:complete len:286 (-) Transcript_27538:305-1162(-)
MIHSDAQINAMYAQELNAYCTEDYLSEHEFSASRNSVDTECRYKMAEWSYQVASFCRFNRETVAISMNYLDRLLMTSKGEELLKNRKLFQLAAMACLYTAVKIHEAEVMEPKIVQSLSQGLFNVEEVEKMERSILISLNWRMNPPTALSFIRQFVSLFPRDALSETEIEELMEYSTIQIELAVRSYVFVGLKASHIGFAALKNSMLCSDIDSEIIYLLSSVFEDNPHNSSPGEIFDIQEKLHSAISATSSNHSDIAVKRLRTISKIRDESIAYSNSPRSILKATN